MRKILTALFALIALAGFNGFETEAEAHHLKMGAKASDSAHRPGCQTVYHRKRMYAYAKTRYMRRDKPMTKGQVIYVKHVAWCLPTRKGSKWAFEKKEQWRKKFRQRLAYQRLTPYVCSNGTRWAIPCYVVYCESKYSWSAYNPSGARGPYQFLGWNVPWPVNSRADKMAHHRMAIYLWNDSPSHWVCA